MRATTATTDHARRPAGRAPRVRLLGAVAVALSLLATPAVTTSRLAGASPAGTAADLPAPPSQPAPERHAQPLDATGALDQIPPHPSQVAAHRPAPKPSRFDPARSLSLDAEATATRRVWINDDGTRTAAISTRPSRYFDGSRWVDYDLRLAPGTDGALHAAAAPGAARLAASVAGPLAGVASVDTSAGTLALRHPEAVATAVGAAVAGPSATYGAGLAGGRSVEEAATADGFEETVVLPAAASPAAYLDAVSLPAGVTARQATASTVEFVDASGSVLASFGAGRATDAAFPSGGLGATAAVSVQLVATTTVPRHEAVLSVGVDPTWLAAPGRAWPVRIDPVFSTDTSATGTDTYVYSSDPASSFGTSNWLFTGSGNGGVSIARSLVRFDLSGIPASNFVTDAHLSAYEWYAPGCTATTVVASSLAAPFSNTTTWNTRPATDAAVAPVTSAPFALGASGCPAGRANLDVTAIARHWILDGAANYGLQLAASSETDPAANKGYNSGETGAAYAPTLYVTYDRLPTQASAASPTSGTTVSSSTPRLSINPATDPDGDTVEYFYRLTEATDAESGPKVESSWWTTATSWDVPAGYLADGVTYTWHAWTRDATGYVVPTWTASFTVDLNLGRAGPAPLDDVGGVGVNLATGNLTLATASPTLATAAGQVGVSLAYNAQAPDAGAGVVAQYYADPAASRDFTGKTSAVERREPSVNSAWGSGASPAPGVAGQNYLVRWSGQLRLPNAGTWRLGAGADGGVRIWLNGTMILNTWTTPPGMAGAWSNELSLPANTAEDVVVEYWHGTGAGYVSFTAAGPVGTGGAFGSTIVPAGWLSIAAPAALPAGWSLSAGLGGTGSFDAARPSTTAATLTDASGSGHRWTRTATSFAPPPGEAGVLGTDGGGHLSLHGTDGTTYAFDAGGRLASATAATAPGAIAYDWGSASPPRLRFVRDTVANRAIALHYGGDAGQCGFATTGGFDATPAGMLCQVDYWDGTTTKLYYLGGQLARVVDPGGSVTQFTYQGGLLRSARTPLAADAVAAGQAADAETANTVIDYDTSHRAVAVTLPQPTPGAARPQRSYAYATGSANTAETTIKVAGLNPAGFFRKVGFSAGRPVSDTDATGKVSTATWDPAAPLVWSSTDPAGRTTTYLYDRAHRPTDVYGPAPGSCFGSDRRPNGTCAPMPHTATTYDNIAGLGAVYWNNTAFAGAPAAFATGVGSADGSLVRNWGTGSPAAGVGVDGWSARFSGEVNLTAAGSYSFSFNVDDTAQLWIDDTPVVSAGCCGPSGAGTFTVSAADVGWHRVRVDYTEATSTAWVELDWTPPGGSAGIVPGDHLRPGYGLVTRTTTDDASPGSPPTVVDVAYADPTTGQATATTTGGLTTSASFEAAGTLGRRLSRTLPAGTATTYTYYATGETPPPSCAGVAPEQSGLLHKATGPNPSGSSGARVDEYVYDAAGHTVGSRIGTGDWDCTSLDGRGRPTSRTIPAFGGALARTVSYNWAVGANPLQTSVTDPAGTISTTTDLLGRPVSYTDAAGNTTTSTYDLAGRVSTTAVAARGWSAGMEYDDAGRPTRQLLEGSPVAVPTYDAAGELASVDYPLGISSAGNGTALSAITKDAAGRLTGLEWRRTTTNTVIASDTVTRSQSGRVMADTVTGTPTATYTYDTAGRLVGATAPGHTYSYGFDASGGCGPLAGAGRNGNRTSFSDTTSTTTTTTYCYDNADKLVSSSDASVGSPVYDPHGNTTTLGSQSMTYDGADRHTATTSGSTAVSYTRDATDRIVSRLVNGSVVATYGYSGPGDSPDMVTAAIGVLGATATTRFVALLGGASINQGGLTGDTWSYPNVHGDIMLTANNVGLEGATYTYDPFGNPLGNLPDDAPGNFDFGWLGQRQRGLEHEGGLATIEMGARQYSPKIGRFLEVDPVEAGCANDYMYGAGDPIDSNDLSGNHYCKVISAAAAISYGEALLGGASAADIESMFGGPIGEIAGKAISFGARTEGQLFVRAGGRALKMAAALKQPPWSAKVIVLIPTIHLPFVHVDTHVPLAAIPIPAVLGLGRYTPSKRATGASLCKGYV